VVDAMDEVDEVDKLHFVHFVHWVHIVRALPHRFILHPSSFILLPLE